jgi:hypothetical protein
VKPLQLATFIVLVLGLITTNIFFTPSPAAGFVLLPYVIMLGVAAYKNYKNPAAASHIALFIASFSICALKFSEYYKATYHPGSSTAGLIFLVMPVFSVVLFAGIYAIANALIRLKVDNYEESIVTKKPLTIGLITLGIWAGYLIYRSALFNRSSQRETYYQERDFTNGDVAKAKKLGLL